MHSMILYGNMDGNTCLYDMEKDKNISVDIQNQIQTVLGEIGEKIYISMNDDTIWSVDKEGRTEKIFSKNRALMANAFAAAIVSDGAGNITFKMLFEDEGITKDILKDFIYENRSG